MVLCRGTENFTRFYGDCAVVMVICMVCGDDNVAECLFLLSLNEFIHYRRGKLVKMKSEPQKPFFLRHIGKAKRKTNENSTSPCLGLPQVARNVYIGIAEWRRTLTVVLSSFNTIYTMFAHGRHRQDDGKRIVMLLSDQTEGGLCCHTVATMVYKRTRLLILGLLIRAYSKQNTYLYRSILMRSFQGIGN